MSHIDYIRQRPDGKAEGRPIYAGGHVVGQVRGGVFLKVISKRHYLINPPALAFSIESLDQAEAAGAVIVQVRDRDTGTIYRATMAHIRQDGFVIKRAGFERQLALPLDGWTTQLPEQLRQPPLFDMGGL